MSATLSPELNSLKKVVLHSPAVLKLEEDEGASTAGKKKEGNLTQFYLSLPKKDKTLIVYVFLKVRSENESTSSILISQSILIKFYPLMIAWFT